MAIKQSDFAKGIRTAPNPPSHGAVHVAKFTFDAAGGVGATDIIEIGYLPAHATIADAILIPEGTWETSGSAAITCSVGIMSGDVGSTDSGRTAGAEIFAAATAMTAMVRMQKGESVFIAASDKHRSIGVKVSGALPAGAGPKLTLALFYAM